MGDIGLGSVRPTLLFQNGCWKEVAEPWAVANRTRFQEIKYFYANLIDYARVILVLMAAVTIYLNQPAWSAFLIIFSTLLDWVDGPVARACGQCSIFGSGVDWLADLLCQIVTMCWWAQMDVSILPWLMLMTTIETGTAIFDFATTATGRYPKLGEKEGGFLVILDWTMPAGCYNWFGTFLWLAYPFWSVAWCLDLSWPVRSYATELTLKFLEWSLLIPTIMYGWNELAYGVFIVTNWTEPARKIVKN